MALRFDLMTAARIPDDEPCRQTHWIGVGLRYPICLSLHPSEKQFRGVAPEIVDSLLHDAHGGRKTVGKIEVIEAEHGDPAWNCEMKRTQRFPGKTSRKIVCGKDSEYPSRRVDML